jgi:hypothetical protein
VSRCPALLSLLALFAGGTAAAVVRPVASVEVLTGGGYDTNLFLQIAAVPDSPTYRPYSGWFARLFPAGLAALSGDSARLELRYGADMRQTVGSGTLFIQDAQLGLSLPELGPFGVRVAATGGRFDATIDPSLRFWSGGGAGELTWRALDRVRVGGAYRVAWRAFGVPAMVGIDSDLAQIGELRVAYAPSPALEVGASGAYLNLRSTLYNEPATTPLTGALARLQRFHGGLDTSFTPAGRVSAYGAAWAGTQRSESTASDRQIGGSAAVIVRLGRTLDAVARYDFFVDWRRPTDSTYMASYQRQIGMLGLIGHAVAMRRAALVRPAEHNQAPEVAGGKVRFRLRAPGASSVVVIGSWNDWTPDRVAQRLQRTRDPEVWEGWVEVEPGNHRYHFLVDGRPMRPVDAAQYRPDGFGGEDGVLTVPVK